MTRPAQGLGQRVRAWRQKWYYLPDDERSLLRKKYNDDKQAYFADFRLNNEEQDKMLERGMAIFTQLEARLERKAQFDFYEQQAKMLCTNLISNPTLKTSVSNLVFVAIDFEGTSGHRGVTELGLARLDMCHLEDGIRGTNIATASRKRRNYLFHDYMRIDIAQLPAAIVKNLSDKQIILVGHSISHELSTMKQLGVCIEDLPNVIGVVDTFRLASAEIGHFGSLQSTMDALQIPNELNTFHCAGNDAYYTMQVFLALIVGREQRREQRAGGLDDLKAFQRLRELAWEAAPLKREIRDQLKEEDAYEQRRKAESYAGFGDMFGD